MPYTYDQAITELAGRNSLADLVDLARSTSARDSGAPQDATSLLYAGTVNGEQAFVLAESVSDSTTTQAGEGRYVRVDDSAVGRLLRSDAFVDKLRAAIEADVAARTPGFNEMSVEQRNALLIAESNRIWSNKDATGNTRLPYDPNNLSLWDLASKNFVEQATGDFRVLAADVDANSVLMQTELTALLARGGNFQVDGVDIQHLRGIEGVDAGRSAILAMAEAQTFFSDVRSSSPGAYTTFTPDEVAAAMNDPIKVGAFSGRLNFMPEEIRARLETGQRAMQSAGAALASSGLVRGLNKLGLVGGLLGFAVAANAAEQAHDAGQSERAKEIMKEWAVDAAGSEIGSIVGGAIGGLLVGAAAVAGVALSAPLAGAIVLGGVVIGGFFGAEGAMEFYRQLDDRDGNGRRDIMDRLSNLLFGATSTLTTPLPADLNGARFTIDASLTRDEIVVQARTSIAWRYALRELNSFVITDVDYARHNADGSLDLYDEQTGQGAMTERFVQDRAAMLTWKLQFERDGARDADDGPRTGAKPYNEDKKSQSANDAAWLCRA